MGGSSPVRSISVRSGPSCLTSQTQEGIVACAGSTVPTYLKYRNSINADISVHMEYTCLYVFACVFTFAQVFWKVKM